MCKWFGRKNWGPPKKIRISKIEKTALKYNKQGTREGLLHNWILQFQINCSMHVFERKKIMNRVVDFVNHVYIVVLNETFGLDNYDLTGRT